MTMCRWQTWNGAGSVLLGHRLPESREPSYSNPRSKTCLTISGVQMNINTTLGHIYNTGTAVRQINTFMFGMDHMLKMWDVELPGFCSLDNQEKYRNAQEFQQLHPNWNWSPGSAAMLRHSKQKRVSVCVLVRPLPQPTHTCLLLMVFHVAHRDTFQQLEDRHTDTQTHTSVDTHAEIKNWVCECVFFLAVSGMECVRVDSSPARHYSYHMRPVSKNTQRQSRTKNWHKQCRSPLSKLNSETKTLCKQTQTHGSA